MSSLLAWNYNTPWDNYTFEVFRGLPGSPFDKIADVTSDDFKDSQNLENGQEYCYYVKAYGDYGLSGIGAPLINFSQIACVTPADNVAPCAPEIVVTNVCDGSGPGIPNDPFANRLSWKLICPDPDIDYFILYYAGNPGDPFEEIARVGASQTVYDHKPGDKIAGCYTIVAVDLNGNASAFAKPFCVQNCPVFELPNAFTPNGDGQNDVFRPTKFRFIERVRFQVFNRWGQIVYETADPMINWNGLNHSGKAVSDGVYFFSCEAYESQGLTSINLSGYIELIRG
jgi:gliding motility-associated-like protein